MSSAERPFDDFGSSDETVPASAEAQREFEEAQKAAVDAAVTPETAGDVGYLITRLYWS